MPESAGREIEIGGPEVVTHLDLVNEMAAALGRRPPRRIAMSAEVARPATVAAGAAAVTSGDPEIASQISLGLTTPDRGRRPERRRAVHDRARARSTRCSPRRSTPPRRPPDGRAASASRSCSPPSRERVWDTVMDPALLERWVTTHDSLRGRRPGPLSTRATSSPRSCAWPASRSRSAGGWSRPSAPRLARWEGEGPAGSTAERRLPARPPRTAAPGSTTRTSSRCPGGVLGKAAGGLLSAAPGGREARRSLERLRIAARERRRARLAGRARPRSPRRWHEQRQQRVDQHREHPGADQRDRDLACASCAVSRPIWVIATSSGSAAAENSASGIRSGRGSVARGRAASPAGRGRAGTAARTRAPAAAWPGLESSASRS